MMYDELIKRLRVSCEACKLWDGYKCYLKGECSAQKSLQAADAIEATRKAYQMMAEAYEAEATKQGWIPVTERLPECEWGAEVENIEWISCGMVFAGCFGRGGKYRDAYFRTWTDVTEGIDAKDADYWRPIQIPESPKEGE